MGDAVAKLGWFLGAMLILLMLAAWKKVEESSPSHSESFVEAAHSSTVHMQRTWPEPSKMQTDAERYRKCAECVQYCR